MSYSVDISCSVLERSRMDRRGWPWKKKSSEKSAAEKVIATLDSAGAALPSGGSQPDKGQEKHDKHKKANYVQISIESYTHLSGLENQVKTYEEQVKTYEEQVKAYEEQAQTYEDQVKTLEEEVNELNEKVSSANSEITTKEELVKQHAKVAEEAVSGWEKAEAEALSLKNHLESVTLEKLTAEDRAAHLDGALKECMRQIRNLKEENEQKLQELGITKNKQYDRMKHELEAKIASMDQELMRAEAESNALSRSLQERSNMLMKTNEEKSKAEAEIEHLKSNVESCEREINSLKYELHIVSKELEIRNEERNMSVKSAEAANKQQLESVKKITKLEAECQRLRGLVRKKLPGPAALAQMKLEVESLGRDHGESRMRRSPARPSSPQYSSNSHMSPVPEFSLDGSQKFQKENEYLTERLLAMEEETKMLKEALAKRNSELQTSRSICAKTASKLQNLEAQVQIFNQQKGFVKPDTQVQADRSSSQHVSNPPSMMSFSEDGNDDTVSCAESWASALISELSHIKDNSKEKSMKTENGKHLELMDDFEEMEKLALLSDDSNCSISITNSPANKSVTSKSAVADVNGTNAPSKTVPGSNSVASPALGNLASGPKVETELLPLVSLQSRISKVFESVSNDSVVVKVLEDIKHAVQEVHETLNPHSISCVFEEKHCSEGDTDQQVVPGDAVATTVKEIYLSENGRQKGKIEKISEELAAAISQIHNFVLFLGKESRAVNGLCDDNDALGLKVEQFSASFNSVMCNETSLDDLVFSLSDFMAKASELNFSVLGYKGNETEVNSPDCIDKIALPENKPPQGESYSNGCSLSDSSSNPEVPQDANVMSGFEPQTCKFSVEEFEQLKAEKDNLEREYSQCSQDLETAKSQLLEMEQQLAGVNSELASSQNMNSLAETQLKCMAESYKMLEKRAEELQSEVSILRSKLESLDNELEAEKVSHQDALVRCKDLEEQLQRNVGCSVCSSSAVDADDRTKQEKDLAAAAEKLAECQETIFLLGKQLKTLHPQSEFMGSPISERSHRDEGLNEEEPTTSGMNLQDLDHVEMDTATSNNLQRLGSSSPSDLYNAPISTSDTEGNSLKSPVSKNARHRPTKSGSSTSSTPTPEKQSRGFSRFFSSKGKIGI
ncbi:filament-like plant protein 4 isoform X1 [Chenopodium quinoa]|uniref:filament-like plant protein 4 isoform X1 n=2 Tax=Chenopodium quinoa TaxID=63459 RepID=UPI000B78734E|nr:filament-like plant protein 4 isoform X1 [Chenopodium quinoa]